MASLSRHRATPPPACATHLTLINCQPQTRPNYRHTPEIASRSIQPHPRPAVAAPPPPPAPRRTPRAMSAPPPPTLSAAALDAPRALAPLLDGVPPPAGYERLASHARGPADRWELYSRPVAGRPALSEFLCVGTAPVAARAMFDVIMDAAYRLRWDASCAAHTELAVFAPPGKAGTHSLNHWVVKYPFPLSKRDYVYERVTAEEAGGGFVLATAAAHHPARPETSKYVRVVDSKTGYVLRPASEEEMAAHGPHCRFVYTAIDDPRGVIPSAVVSFITSKTLPSVMDGMYKAAKDRQ